MAKKTKKSSTGKLRCTKCNSNKGISKDRIIKLIAQFGTLEKIRATYVCRSCRAKLNVRKDGLVKPKRTPRKPKKVWTELPRKLVDISTSEPRKLTAEELRDTDVCWSPDVWARDHFCDNCYYYQTNACGCKNKVLYLEKKSKKSKKIKKVKKVRRKKVSRQK